MHGRAARSGYGSGAPLIALDYRIATCGTDERNRFSDGAGFWKGWFAGVPISYTGPNVGKGSTPALARVAQYERAENARFSAQPLDVTREELTSPAGPVQGEGAAIADPERLAVADIREEHSNLPRSRPQRLDAFSPRHATYIFGVNSSTTLPEWSDPAWSRCRGACSSGCCQIFWA
jgi:hypothetical protein